MKGTFRPLPELYSKQLKDLVGLCTKVEPNDRPNTQALMGHLFLQGLLLETQFTVGRIQLSDDPVF